MAGQLAASNLIKFAVERVRPDLGPMGPLGTPSFPSGHSTAAASKAAQIQRLERAVDGMDGAPEPKPESQREPKPEQVAATYLVFVGTPGGYALQAAWGDVPPVGGRISVDGLEHVVAKLGRSPLPGDARRCAYLEPA